MQAIQPNSQLCSQPASSIAAFLAYGNPMTGLVLNRQWGDEGSHHVKHVELINSRITRQGTSGWNLVSFGYVNRSISKILPTAWVNNRVMLHPTLTTGKNSKVGSFVVRQTTLGKLSKESVFYPFFYPVKNKGLI